MPNSMIFEPPAVRAGLTASHYPIGSAVADRETVAGGTIDVAGGVSVSGDVSAGRTGSRG
ncbi:hypothetical protein [Rugosimonospora africana]|uniref:Uncharacterized protein n=1 Tax=Rugosimonospora africana TaxID=556532 RepID=A0A8J3VRG6_9ACTN|nr:hypothetical protein [Rugosimonospora africana]GIH15373.1 hypothetical protein Raf01_35450 [Rugosimonospora africana]